MEDEKKPEIKTISEGTYRIFFWIALAGIGTYFLIHEQIVQDQFNRIERNTDKIIQIDSIARVLEERIMDSLESKFEQVEVRIKRDSMEIVKIRRANARLEKSFRDIDVSDRPRY